LNTAGVRVCSGAILEPFDGGALSLGVNALAGDGTKGGDATLHGADTRIPSLDWFLLKRFFEELRERLAGGRGKGRGSSSRSRTGRCSFPPPPARAPAAGKKTRRRRCSTGLRG
jgi:hypothetical protein